MSNVSTGLYFKHPELHCDSVNCCDYLKCIPVARSRRSVREKLVEVAEGEKNWWKKHFSDASTRFFFYLHHSCREVCLEQL